MISFKQLIAETTSVKKTEDYKLKFSTNRDQEYGNPIWSNRHATLIKRAGGHIYDQWEEKANNSKVYSIEVADSRKFYNEYFKVHYEPSASFEEMQSFSFVNSNYPKKNIMKKGMKRGFIK